jgi:transposase
MDVNPKQRRRHSAEFKAQVLAACREPGASVAAVALSFKLNDNLVHQWRRGRGASPVSTLTSTSTSTTVAESAPQFIALSLPPPALPPSAPPSAPAPAVACVAVAAEAIHLEFKRGVLGVSVTWPVSAAADCAAWLREVLR